MPANDGVQVPVPVYWLSGCAPVTCVPGATRSGLRRPSSVGPRLEKLATWRALSALASGVAQPSTPLARTPSDAPTVMTFFAVASEWIVPCPTVPSLPAANTSTSCWLPAVPDWASRTSWS